MEFRPSFDQPLLTQGKRARDLLDRVYAEDGGVLLVIGMEVSDVMAFVQFDKHADYYSIET